MQTSCIDNILNYLKENLSDEKYRHSLGTARAAREIAQIVGYDTEKAYLAGLLHDCAKSLCCDEMLGLCCEGSVSLEDGEGENAKVLHAPAGCVLACEKFGVKDADILNAIRWHTLGNSEMSILEKIVFLADKIEPETRGNDEYKRRLKNVAEEKGLEKEIFECYAYTIKSLVDRNLKICQKTIDVYNSLLRFLK